MQKIMIVLLALLTSCQLIPAENYNVSLIKVYISDTTVPIMAFLGDLVTTPKDVPKIVYTSRFNNDINYSEYNIIKITDTDNSYRDVLNKINLYPNAQVEIHTERTPRVLIEKFLKEIPLKRIKHVHLYDEGSAEYVHLYNYKNDYTAAEFATFVEKSKQQWRDYFNNITDKDGGLRYTLAEILPMTFHMLRPDYITLHPELAPLTKYNYQAIDFISLAATWTEEQKQYYYDFIGFDKSVIEQLYSQSSNPKFAITGTTTWASGNSDRNYFAQEQIKMVNNITNSSGILHKYLESKTYDFFFKLHPKGADINDKIVATFPTFHRIPDNVGYEALLVSGLIPEKTGGVLSSLYFTIPKDKIAFILQADNQVDSLVEILKELQIVDSSKIHTWNDLANI